MQIMVLNSGLHFVGFRFVGLIFSVVALGVHSHEKLLAPTLTLALAAGLAILVLVLFVLRRSLFKLPYVGLVVFIGWVALCAASYFSSVATQRLSERVPDRLSGNVVWLIGRVSAITNVGHGGVRFRFQTEAQASVAAMTLSLNWYQPRFELLPGQRWQLAVGLRQPTGSVNPGGFDAQESALRQRVDGFGSVVLKKAGVSYPPRQLVGAPTLGDRIELLRLQISQGFDRLNPNSSALSIGLLKALSIGEQSALSTEQWQLFNRTGTSHLISISGMHVTMLAALAGWVASRLWGAVARAQKVLHFNGLVCSARSHWRVIAMIFTATVYCAMAGWGIPAQRTLIMLIVFLLLRRLSQPSQFLYVVQMTALVLLLLDPLSISAPGFWLSFLAVVCLHLSNPPDKNSRANWKNWLIGTGRTQLACTMGLAPLLAYFYASFSFSSIFANSLAIPVIGFFVTPLAVFIGSIVLLSQWFTFLWPLATFGLWLAQTAIDPLMQFMGWIDQFKHLNQPLPLNHAWLALVACALMAFAVGYQSAKWRALSALSAVIILIWPSAKPEPSEWQLHVIDVGNGAASLLRSRDHAVLIDTGPGVANGSDAGANIVAPYLYRLGIKTLDAVVLTHDDSQHIGGTRSILQLFEVKRIVRPQNLARASLFDLPDGIEQIDCQRGGQLLLGLFAFDFLHPSAVFEQFKRSNANAHSCVLIAKATKRSVLFTADIQAEQEHRLNQLYGAQLKADVLIVPNAGSAASSSLEFIAAVAPVHAVFQVGHYNRYGYPRPEVLARYQLAGTQLHRTNYTGAVQFDFSETGIKSSAARQRYARYWHTQKQ
jgi:competence protein ComEC